MSEWIVVAVIGVILLFSAKKLPDMARGLGQSMRIFKAETRGMREDDQKGAEKSTEKPAVGPAAPGRAADDPAPSATQAPSASQATTEPGHGGSSAG